MLFKSRYSLLLAILAFYFVPLLSLNMLVGWHSQPNWQAFALGLAILSIGSLVFFLLLGKWEGKLLLHQEESLGKLALSTESLLSRASEPASLQSHEDQSQYAELLQEKEHLQALLQEESQAAIDLRLENDHHQELIKSLNIELAHVKETAQEKLEQNQIFLREHQQTITEQRQSLEIKQQHIQQLEDKVRDLTYEIKTLLNLAERTPDENSLLKPAFVKKSPAEALTLAPTEPLPPPVNEGSYHLRRCLEIAQRMTGASHYNRSAKRTDLPIEHYALDLRCLSDSLKSENIAIIIYSMKENKLIYANHHIKALLGWTSEKFIQNFHEIIEDCLAEWDASLSQLAYKNECQVNLQLKSKSAPKVSVKGYLGVIPTGIFRSHIMGVLEAKD